MSKQIESVTRERKAFWDTKISILKKQLKKHKNSSDKNLRIIEDLEDKISEFQNIRNSLNEESKSYY